MATKSEGLAPICHLRDSPVARQRRSFSHSILPFVLAFIALFCIQVKTGMSREHRVGGECEYKKYEGEAKITSIEKVTASSGEARGRYEVKFAFTPDRKVEETFAQTEGREFLLMVGHAYYPGPKFLEKYGIEVGKVFRGYLKVIIRGTCTPILFEFPSIRLDDYGED
jgi:hypothetical protein